MESLIRTAFFAILIAAVPGTGVGLLGGPAGEAPEKGNSEDNPKEEKGAKEEPRDAFKKASDLSDREKKILALFTATTKGFKEGKLYLRYDFERQAEELAEDWLPTLEQAKPRIRWAKGLELYYTIYDTGLLIGDYGEWIHKAVFLSDIEVTVDLMSVAPFREGNILGPTFYNEKKKRAIGANGGYQAMYLSGWKAAKPMHPKVEKKIMSNQRMSMGYRYDGKILECYSNGRKSNDTSSVPKYAEKFDTGHVGLAWSGSIQSIILSITIQGRLDPDWTAKQLGETLEKPGKGGPKKK